MTPSRCVSSAGSGDALGGGRSRDIGHTGAEMTTHILVTGGTANWERMLSVA